MAHPDPPTSGLTLEILALAPRSGGGMDFAGDFLLGDRRDFGSAINTIAMTMLLVPSGVRPRVPEERLEIESHDPATEEFDRHHFSEIELPTFRRRRATAPKITYRRSARKVEITFASHIDEAALYRPADPDTFAAALLEIADALQLLRKRVKTSDDFNLGEFLEHVASRVGTSPSDPAAFAALQEKLNRQWAERYDAMSDWDKLDIDWSDYPANARDVLPDPIFWSLVDDEAPHGNDTGFDLLQDYLSKRPKNAEMFLVREIREWGYRDLDQLSSTDITTYSEAVIALAFAELKARGSVSTYARDRALAALQLRRSEHGPHEISDLLTQRLEAEAAGGRSAH